MIMMENHGPGRETIARNSDCFLPTATEIETQAQAQDPDIIHCLLFICLTNNEPSP